ncbi:filamentous hemagglutinin N-terminal domain-containing protein, partial [Campylobacter lari]|uniref:two-partner secretion domain-containing protein n=1 Tax=Campylobacter lari TaxID=201 RepID=UPI001BD2053C
EGVLNAGGNNVFLINPNGVIITKTGTINANRFVASTSSMSDGDMTAFANMKNFNDGLSFSPIFKPQKAGNVVNMGNINANNVLLIGNKVDIQSGKVGNKNSTTHLVGKNVYIDADSTNLNSTINVTATEGGYIQRQMINFANSGYNFGNNVKVHKADYKDSSGTTHTGSSNFKKALTIGNMGNEKDNAIEWWHFAKGWNEGLGTTRSVDEFRLVGNIDFNGNKGQGIEGKDWQNYANYWVDLNGDGKRQANEFTNMIVGYKGLFYTDSGMEIDSTFNKTFDGQGFTLKNINIDTTNINEKPQYVGVFGKVGKALGDTNEGKIEIKNINVDYMGGGINAKDAEAVGGFVGLINFNEAGLGKIENITLKDISNISNANEREYMYFRIGGFAGAINNTDVYNIEINDIDKINLGGYYALSEIGGFAGAMGNVKLNNIRAHDIGDIYANAHRFDDTGAEVYMGGFVGHVSGDAEMKNISLNVKGNFHGESNEVYMGGFVGSYNDGKAYFSNILVDFKGNITSNNTNGSSYIGGFVGRVYDANDNSSTFENISIEISGKVNAESKTEGYENYIGGFAGTQFGIFEFKNIYMYFDKDFKINGGRNNIGKFFGYDFYTNNASYENIHIYHHENDLTYAIADKDYWGNTDDKIQIHTYNNSTQESVYKDFLSKANTIEKPSKPSKPTDPTDPNNPDVILGSDDLYADIIMKWIIDELRKENYTIDIKNLVSLINAFKGLNKESREDEIKAIVKAHLDIKDDDKALSMAQSISFLLNYKEHNFDKRLNDEALVVYNNTIKPSVNNTLGIISYLDKNKDYLLEQYNKHKELEQFFKDKEQAYKNAETEFNRLLDLVNKGKLSYNDPKFTQAFDNWLNAYNEYNALSNDISELNNNVASISDGVKDLGYTQFSFVKFDDITKIDLVEPELPDIDNSQGGDLPAFEQTASLNLIGDETLDEEEETEEVDETSLLQKGKTCIV